MRNPFTESAVRCTSAQEFDNAPVDAYLKDDSDLIFQCLLQQADMDGTIVPQGEPSASSKGEEPDLSHMAQPVTPETGAPESPETHDRILGKFLNTSEKILEEAPHTPPVPADDPHRHDEQDAENQPRVPPPR